MKVDKIIGITCLLLILCATGTTRADVIHHWTLDETSGTMVADSIGGKTGAIIRDTGADLTMAGVSNTGFDSIGGSSGGYIAASNIFTGNAARAISLWFNADAILGNQARLIGMGRWAASQFDITLETFNGPSIGLRYGNGNISWSATELGGLQTDTWYHLVLQYDGTTLVADSAVQVYVNGTKLTRDGGNYDNSGQTLTTSNTNFWIGVDATKNYTLNGTIDDVQVYDAVLSVDDISFLYNNPGTVIGAEPVAVGPSPDNGKMYVAVDSDLSWTVANVEGFTPKYDVYFGMGDGELELVSPRQVGQSYTPSGMAFGTIYRWRVDVVDESVAPDVVYEGQVWTFTTWAEALKVMEWKLEDAYASGPDWMTADTSGAGNDGTFTSYPVGGPFFKPGLIGNCLELAGFDDSVVKDNASLLPLDDNSSWSMNLYLYLKDRPDDWTRIANFGDDYHRQLLIGRNSEIAFIYQNKHLLLSGKTLDVDRWYMLTVTHDTSYLKVFIDGIEVISKQLPFSAGEELDPESNMLNYAHAGNFSGRIDEFTIWDGRLPSDMIDQFAGQLPIIGDGDDNGTVDIDDLIIVAANWLTDNSSTLADLTLDDFEAYTGDTDPGFVAAWEASGKGTNVLSLGIASGGSQAMTWSYDLGQGREAGLYHWIQNGGVDLSQYDQVHLWIYKNAGSTGDSLFCKFIELGVDETLWDMGEVRVDLNTIPEDTWFEWVVDLDQLQTWDSSANSVPYDRIKDLDGIHVGTYSEAGGSGSIVIDDVQLVRTSARCQESGFVNGDMNGDCKIDLVDLSVFAGSWLN